MKRVASLLFPVLLVVVGLMFVSPILAEQAAKQSAATPTMSAASRERAMASLKKGSAYLKKEQGADGLWDKNLGLSGVAALALINEPGTTKEEAPKGVGKTLQSTPQVAKPAAAVTMFCSEIPNCR